MKDDKDNKDDLIVDIDESQLALPMEDKDELVVETKVDDKAEEVKAEAAEKKERKRHNQDAIDALQAQLRAREDENQRLRHEKDETERRLKSKEQELGTAREHVAQSDYDRVQFGITAAKAREGAIKREMKFANEAGDHDKYIELQGELVRVAARTLQYEDEKVRLERRAEQEREAPQGRPVEREPERNSTPTFEDRISGMSPKSQAWLRAHPECVTDPADNAKVMWAHTDAMKRGIPVDSNDYFNHIENLMGYGTEADDDDVEVSEASRAESRRGVPAAPVSRDARPGSQLAPGKYRLSREEVEMAEAMGISPAKYAENKIKMQKQGLWTN